MASPKHKSVKTDVIQLNRPPSKEWTRHDLNLDRLACAGSEQAAGSTLSGVYLLGQLAGSVGRGRSVAELASRALRVVLQHTGGVRAALLLNKRGRFLTLASATLEETSRSFPVDRSSIEYAMTTGHGVAYAHEVGQLAFPIAYVPLGEGRTQSCLVVERAGDAEAFGPSGLESLQLLGAQVQPILDGEIAHQRLRLGRENEELRARQARVLDAIPLGIAVVGEGGVLEGLNNEARKLFHSHTPPGASTVVKTFSINEMVQEAMDNQHPPRRDVEVPGAILTIGAYPVEDAKHESAEGVALVFQDVTEVRAAEAHLMETERARALGEGLAGIAHELNNPLTSIIGFVDLLSSQVPGELQETCRHITFQAERCLALAKEVLAFSRRRQREDVDLSLSDLIGRTRCLLKRELEDAQIEFVSEFAEDNQVKIDPRPIQQVLLNLLQNAVHAMGEDEEPSGPLRLTVRTHAVADRLHVEITDTGPGITPEVQKRLFQPFFSTRPKGNGLGLSISEKIVREYGGELTLKSRPGQTTFAFSLPRAEAAIVEPATVDLPIDSSDAESRPGRVLVVDDEESILLCLTQLLNRHGLEVETEASGAPALQRLLRGERYDAILMDVRMPGFGGLEILRQLQSRRSDMADRCVLMTGEIDEEILGQVRDLGVAVLSKPFRLTEVMAVLGTIVEDSIADPTRPVPVAAAS